MNFTKGTSSKTRQKADRFASNTHCTDILLDYALSGGNAQSAKSAFAQAWMGKQCHTNVPNNCMNLINMMDRIANAPAEFSRSYIATYSDNTLFGTFMQSALPQLQATLKEKSKTAINRINSATNFANICMPRQT